MEFRARRACVTTEEPSQAGWEAAQCNSCTEGRHGSRWTWGSRDGCGVCRPPPTPPGFRRWALGPRSWPRKPRVPTSRAARSEAIVRAPGAAKAVWPPVSSLLDLPRPPSACPTRPTDTSQSATPGYANAAGPLARLPGMANWSLVVSSRAYRTWVVGGVASEAHHGRRDGRGGSKLPSPLAGHSVFPAPLSALFAGREFPTAWNELPEPFGER